jgi:hypothetical protein
VYIQARGKFVLQARRIVRFKLFVQFMSDMPKLLFVGIVERACRATVIREIPGITDCFQTKGDSQEGSAPEIKVHYRYPQPYRRLCSRCPF